MIKQAQRLLLTTMFFISFCNGETKEEFLVRHVKDSLEKAEQGQSKLNKDALSVWGFSATKIKHLLNNLCTLKNAEYLEIGVLGGSTFVAAVYGNENTLGNANAVDNWSEFGEGGHRNGFYQNIAKFIPHAKIRLFEENCFLMDLGKFSKPVNIYFYDGNHDYLSQKLAFTYFDPIFDDTFIALIDDWGWQNVHKGTLDALSELNYEVLFRKDLYSQIDPAAEYWNGLSVMVLKKRP